jgi:hypothetical protein
MTGDHKGCRVKHFPCEVILEALLTLLALLPTVAVP